MEYTHEFLPHDLILTYELSKKYILWTTFTHDVITL